MNTYFIPKKNYTRAEYYEYCSSLPFVFNGARTLNTDYVREYVTLDGTITGFDQITVIPPPEPPVIISKLQFLGRFTNAELATILTVAKTNAMIEVFVKKLDLSVEVDLRSSRTIEGVNALEAGGLLTTGRATQILTI